MKEKLFPVKDNMKHKGTSYITEEPILYTGSSDGLEINSLWQSMHLADVTCSSIIGIFYLYSGAPG